MEEDWKKLWFCGRPWWDLAGKESIVELDGGAGGGGCGTKSGIRKNHGLELSLWSRNVRAFQEFYQKSSFNSSMGWFWEGSFKNRSACYLWRRRERKSGTEGLWNFELSMSDSLLPLLIICWFEMSALALSIGTDEVEKCNITLHTWNRIVSWTHTQEVKTIETLLRRCACVVGNEENEKKVALSSHMCGNPEATMDAKNPSSTSLPCGARIPKSNSIFIATLSVQSKTYRSKSYVIGLFQGLQNLWYSQIDYWPRTELAVWGKQKEFLRNMHMSVSSCGPEVGWTAGTGSNFHDNQNCSYRRWWFGIQSCLLATFYH